MRHMKILKVAVVGFLVIAATLVGGSIALAGGGGSLTITLDGVELPLDRVGEVNNENDRFEIRDRQYEGEFGAFPVTINGTSFLADEIKVTSDIKVQGGVGEHRGTIEIDIDSIPNGRITLEYSGSVTISDSTIVSSGEFKVIEARDIFDGIGASGSYHMTIVESGSTLGSPATLTISASGN